MAYPAQGALADEHGITAAMLVVLVLPVLAAALTVPRRARRT